MIDLLHYIHQCSPQVAENTMMAIIRTESKGNPLSIGLNKGYKLKFQPVSDAQAQSWVKYLEEHGFNFDVGLAQVNIKNIHKYGYKAVDALDPCTNLKIASNILKKNYSDARNHSNSDSEALSKAISAYNTGNYSSGFNNGYVQKVYANANSSNNEYVPSITHSNLNTKLSSKKSDYNINDGSLDSLESRKSKSVIYVRPRNAEVASN